MPFLTEDEERARNCLKAGSFLIDPKYLSEHHNAEGKFKERCKACWHLRQWFPEWVQGYVKKWTEEKANVGGLPAVGSEGSGSGSL